MYGAALLCRLRGDFNLTPRNASAAAAAVWLQAVVVNLCLADEPALLLGIENLVCEVQLVLDAFDKLLQVLISVFRDCNEYSHSRGSNNLCDSHKDGAILAREPPNPGSLARKRESI